MAPSYDPNSNRIVWHRLIDGRYQIVSYDLRTAEEVVLTKTNYNNMEPVAYGDITVWQSWIESGWEIVMYRDDEIIQLTENTVHDVAPYINKDYVIWQTQVSDSWYMSLYDRDTGVIERILNEEGARIENPRFVLVYDAHMENGDVQTLGYDLESKKIVPLSSTPAPLPKKLPEPDQTGEKRALIQNKPPTEEDIVIVNQGNGDDDPHNQTPISTTTRTILESATTTDNSALVIPALLNAATSTEEILHIEPLIVEDVQAVVDLPVVNATTTQNEHIDDVVIPAVTPPTTP